ncbi:AI-2E family transporter [Clostridium sp. CTA-19]
MYILVNKKPIYYLVILNLILLGIFLLTKVNFILTPLVSLKDAMLIPMILAIFLYYILRPINRFLKDHNVPNALATIITIVSIIVLIVMMSIFTGSVVANEGASLIESLNQTLENLANKYSYLFPQLNDILKFNDMLSRLSSFITTSFLDISMGAFSVVGSVGNFFAQLILIPIIMFYILKDEYRIYNSLCNFLPSKSKTFIIKILKDIDTVLKQYISAQVMVAFILGSLMFIGYLILGMPNAFVLSFFSFITSFIPFLGAVLGVFPALILALGMGFPMVIKVVLLAIIVQQLEGNVITPNITGNQLNMYPLTTIIVITASVYFGGFFAAFVAVPIYNIFKVLIINIWNFTKQTKTKKILDNKNSI